MWRDRWGLDGYIVSELSDLREFGCSGSVWRKVDAKMVMAY